VLVQAFFVWQSENRKIFIIVTQRAANFQSRQPSQGTKTATKKKVKKDTVSVLFDAQGVGESLELHHRNYAS
jgi:hypothetical protein